MPTTEELYQDQLSAGSSDVNSGETQQFVTNPMFADYQQRKADDQAAMDTPANTQPAPVKQPDIAPDNDLMKKIYGTPLPKPELDRARLDRLQKLSRVNTISRGIGVLGDALSLGVGANVNRREPDTTTPELARQYQATLDKYKNDKDIYNLRNYQKSIDDAKTEYSMQQAKEANQYKRDILTAKTEQEKREKEFEFNKWRAEQEGKAQDRVNTADYRKGMLGNAHERNKISAEKEKGKVGKPFTQVMVDGKATDLNEAQHHDLYDKALKYYGGEKSDYVKGVTAEFQNNTKLVQQEIMQHYINEQKQNAIDESVKNESMLPHSINNTMWTPPLSEPVAAPSKQGTNKSTPNPAFDPNKYLRKTSAK